MKNLSFYERLEKKLNNEEKDILLNDYLDPGQLLIATACNYPGEKIEKMKYVRWCNNHIRLLPAEQVLFYYLRDELFFNEQTMLYNVVIRRIMTFTINRPGYFSYVYRKVMNWHFIELFLYKLIILRYFKLHKPTGKHYLLYRRTKLMEDTIAIKHFIKDNKLEQIDKKIEELNDEIGV